MNATTTTTRTYEYRLTGAGIIRSEFIKLRTVRSTVWLYASMVVTSVGIAALVATASGNTSDSPILPLTAATIGTSLGQLVAAVLGVLVVSGEYATGMIRSTISAVPKRLPALGAKMLVLFVTTFVVGLVSTFGALFAALPILGSQGVEADYSDGTLVGSLMLAALYLALVSVFSLGLGTLLRNSAAGIAVALGTILLLPTIMQIISALTQAQWALDLLPYLFSSAGMGMYLPGTGSAGFDQWQSTLIVLAWVAAPVIAGAVLLKRRDA
ncbi:ABC transporter permease subunit [Cryobacterium sp. TMT3-29-2]|uniref:ABC transporter permease subunit n=1 Tax=Cryobacterium sp. TMT3-29-2 TaxID=2555867 RepID=UPI00107312E7|nr:ABC transporter permease subunit [Cryobacterium sp. TMT3-29-2]TFC89917.1 ABC transporter permease [Cryobacterium sp. TMT3-29-2]